MDLLVYTFVAAAVAVGVVKVLLHIRRQRTQVQVDARFEEIIDDLRKDTQ